MGMSSSTAAEIRAIGRQAWTVVCDMGNPAECETVCQKIVAELDHRMLQDIKYRLGNDRLPSDAMDQLTDWFGRSYGWSTASAPLEAPAALATKWPTD